MEKINEILGWYKRSWLFKPSIIIISLIFFTLLMDKIVMPWYVKLGDETELPDVIEMNVDQAKNLLEKNGFRVIIQDSLYHANYAVGTVIEQNPYPYATVKKERRVYLTVSIGEKPIKMPKLIGLSPRDAELILRSFSLKLRSKNYVYSDFYIEGTVIGQSYPQGQVIRSGSQIDITISLGKFKEESIVPDLVGKSLREANQQLALIGLNIGNISFEEKNNILPETVLSQSIKPGEKFEKNQEIDLVVSKEILPE